MEFIYFLFLILFAPPITDCLSISTKQELTRYIKKNPIYTEEEEFEIASGFGSGSGFGSESGWGSGEGSAEGYIFPCVNGLTCKFGGICDTDAEDGPCFCDIECSNDNSDIVCATDGRSYQNSCYIRKISCERQMNIQFAYRGPCENENVVEFENNFYITPPTTYTTIPSTATTSTATPKYGTNGNDSKHDDNDEYVPGMWEDEIESSATVGPTRDNDANPCIGVYCSEGRVCIAIGAVEYMCICEGECNEESNDHTTKQDKNEESLNEDDNNSWIDPYFLTDSSEDSSEKQNKSNQIEESDSSGEYSGSGGFPFDFNLIPPINAGGEKEKPSGKKDSFNSKNIRNHNDKKLFEDYNKPDRNDKTYSNDQTNENKDNSNNGVSDTHSSDGSYKNKKNSEDYNKPDRNDKTYSKDQSNENKDNTNNGISDTHFNGGGYKNKKKSQDHSKPNNVHNDNNHSKDQSNKNEDNADNDSSESHSRDGDYKNNVIKEIDDHDGKSYNQDANNGDANKKYTDNDNSKNTERNEQDEEKLNNKNTSTKSKDYYEKDGNNKNESRVPEENIPVGENFEKENTDDQNNFQYEGSFYNLDYSGSGSLYPVTIADKKGNEEKFWMGDKNDLFEKSFFDEAGDEFSQEPLSKKKSVTGNLAVEIQANYDRINELNEISDEVDPEIFISLNNHKPQSNNKDHQNRDDFENIPFSSAYSGDSNIVKESSGYYEEFNFLPDNSGSGDHLITTDDDSLFDKPTTRYHERPLEDNDLSGDSSGLEIEGSYSNIHSDEEASSFGEFLSGDYDDSFFDDNDNIIKSNSYFFPTDISGKDENNDETFSEKLENKKINDHETHGHFVTTNAEDFRSKNPEYNDYEQSGQDFSGFVPIPDKHQQNIENEVEDKAKSIDKHYNENKKNQANTYKEFATDIGSKISDYNDYEQSGQDFSGFVPISDKQKQKQIIENEVNDKTESTDKQFNDNEKNEANTYMEYANDVQQKRMNNHIEDQINGESCANVYCAHGAVCTSNELNEFICSCDNACSEESYLMARKFAESKNQVRRKNFSPESSLLVEKSKSDKTFQIQVERSTAHNDIVEENFFIERIFELKVHKSQSYNLQSAKIPSFLPVNLKERAQLRTKEKRSHVRKKRFRRSEDRKISRAARLINGTVCGTNGITYQDECQLRMHACRSQKSILVKKLGKCSKDRHKLKIPKISFHSFQVNTEITTTKLNTLTQDSKTQGNPQLKYYGIDVGNNDEIHHQTETKVETYNKQEPNKKPEKDKPLIPHLLWILCLAGPLLFLAGYAYLYIKNKTKLTQKVKEIVKVNLQKYQSDQSDKEFLLKKEPRESMNIHLIKNKFKGTVKEPHLNDKTCLLNDTKEDAFVCIKNFRHFL